MGFLIFFFFFPGRGAVLHSDTSCFAENFAAIFPLHQRGLMDYHLLGLILSFLFNGTKVLAGYPIWW